VNNPHTIVLFIFSNTIIDASDAAAPISNANARDIARVELLLNSKKSITCIIEIIETNKYNDTNEKIINQ